MADSEKELKDLMVKEEREKASLILNIQKNENHGIWSQYFMANRRGKIGNSDRLYFLGLQNHCTVTIAMKLKHSSSLEGKL